MHQCEKTLNMLQRSRMNPKMSAHTQLFGEFDYNRIPLAPLRTKAFVHKRTRQRRSHADQEKVGYVIGNSPKHYQHMYFIFHQQAEIDTQIHMYSYHQSLNYPKI